jgi:hypothetical protein
MFRASTLFLIARGAALSHLPWGNGRAGDAGIDETAHPCAKSEALNLELFDL